MRINAVYWSPTGTTELTTKFIASEMSIILQGELQVISLTLPSEREKVPEFFSNDIVVFGLPVYAGRVPNVLLNYLNSIKGNGAYAVPIMTFGNRNYDNALAEFCKILSDNGFKCVAAGVFVGQHSFSNTLGQNRPDYSDFEAGRRLAKAASLRINNFLKGKTFETVNVRGSGEALFYYKPLNEDNKPIDIRKVKPLTKENCKNCGLCAKVCPMGSIAENNKSITGICIKCCACVKKCPCNAKYFDDKDFLYHKTWLEENFLRRVEPELFY